MESASQHAMVQAAVHIGSARPLERKVVLQHSCLELRM